MSDASAGVTEEAVDMEAATRKVSVIVSVLALSLMIVGFADAVLGGMALTVPGSSVLPISRLVHVGQVPLSLAAMSAGVLLLALLPTVRVLLAAVLYIAQRGTLNVAASLAVLVELILSMRAGG